MSVTLTVKAGEIIKVNPGWLESKREEIRKGEEALKHLEAIEGISRTKVGRVRGRLKFLRKFVELLEAGFIPIPRMDFEPLEEPNWRWMPSRKPVIAFDRMPVEAIATVAEYQGKFDRMGIVRPRSRGRKRDPILIGIISYGGLEEHFILGWWRPDTMKETDLW